MKITVSINLGGYSFNIDEDAYDELRRYLRNLEMHFAGEESLSEIMTDIETRMSELFRTKLSAYKQVISVADVREVISVMGTPEDIGEGAGRSAGEKFATPGYHRMYRDPDRRILGGVCAGMGAYWNLEPWVVRLIFLVLAFAGGLGVLTYLILWVVIPEAKSTAQKIEMKGEPVNIHNIKESVRSEFERVRKNMNL
jgi:phage shock protein PspC (stress-responsive transcriptional regulator)